MSTIQGRCLCGSVRFSITTPTLFCAHCHCRFCRGAHGAAFVTWVGVAEESFELAPGGAETLSWYQSSEQSRRAFCSLCGATMLYTSSLAPGEVHIAHAYLEGPIDREPQAHVFYDQKVPWCEVGDDLPRIDSDDERLAKYRRVQ